MAVSVLETRADSSGPVFLATGNRAGAYVDALARLGGDATVVFQQDSQIPDGIGTYVDDAARPCALVSAGKTSYSQCLGGAQQPTGLADIASARGGFADSSRIVGARTSDGTTVFFTFGPFAALDTVELANGKFSLFEGTESSISYPGAAVTVGDLAWACAIGSDGALGLAPGGSLYTRTHDGRSYQDCRMAGDGTNVFGVGVTDAGTASYFTLAPVLDPGAPAPKLSPVPIALDTGQPFDVAFFAGKPSLVQVGADGAATLFAIAADGSLGTARVLATGVTGLEGTVAVGPDGGLHLALETATGIVYVKRCP
jgi:hypothetical protein